WVGVSFEASLKSLQRKSQTGRGRTCVDVASSARMADDCGAKRLKTSQDRVAIAEVAELRGRVAELRRRLAELESENEQLRSDNAQLRRQRDRPPEVPEGVRKLEGNHEVLPVVIVPSTVDLSRVDSSIVAHITSFLGTPRELLYLALTCKSFGWRQPMSTLNWSLVEEVARQTVCSRATDAEMGCLPRYVSGTVTWLAILHKHEHPLDFDVLLGVFIDYENGDKTAVYSARDDGCSVAVSSGYVMRSGVHCAEFLVTGPSPFIGIVRPMPGLDANAYRKEFDFFDRRFGPDFLAQRSDEWGMAMCMRHADRGDWEGMEDTESCDTIGMLLNLDEGAKRVEQRLQRPSFRASSAMMADDDGAKRLCSFIDRESFYPDFIAQRSDEWGDSNVHACEYYCYDGQMISTDWVTNDSEWEEWEGMESCRTGDTIGMLLNLDEGTLTVYKNNRRLGVMKDGLSGLYCWYANKFEGRRHSYNHHPNHGPQFTELTKQRDQQLR
ncbi:hypothetical protein THAOC_04443, partial [Thalassiosira oceanica]